MSDLKLIYTVILLVQAPITYYVEMKGTPLLSLGYSKFRGNGSTMSISSKIGMFASHFVPFLIASACLTYGMIKINPNILVPMNLVTLLYAIQFLRRSLEVLFIHSYSGPIDLLTAAFIAVLYVGNVVFSSWKFVPRNSVSPTHLILIGIFIFLIGQIGNFYYHYRLRNLRKQKVNSISVPSAKGYFLPTGGLFDVLICPHYTFEILSFVGVMVTTNFDYYQLAVVFSVIVYLCTRALMNKRWYVDKGFDKDTINKRYLFIPYVI